MGTKSKSIVSFVGATLSVGLLAASAFASPYDGSPDYFIADLSSGGVPPDESEFITFYTGARALLPEAVGDQFGSTWRRVLG